MRRPLVHRFIQLAALGCVLSATDACAHRATQKPTGERSVAARLDSIQKSSSAGRSKPSGQETATFSDADRTRFTNLGQMIAARFSGVHVQQNGAGYTIRIRGAASFQSATEPLVIVDGATVTAADLGVVDVKDVIRIDVLKDAAASIYGVRGANGVIVITTARR